MSWQSVALGELGEFRNGLNYTKENEGTGLKVIAVKDFSDLRVPNIEALGEINPIGLSVDTAILSKGDIVFVRSNGNKDLIGRSLFIEEEIPNLSFSGFCIRMRPTSKDAVPKFLAYYFRSPLFRKQLSNLGGGTNINNLNQRVMKSFQISIPSPQVQGRIVSCIAAYDDLIESNRRRIDLLEEAARQLYKEWFVRFRFPGHEHVKIIDGVPEGWKQTEIGKLTSFLSRGMTPVYDEEAEYIVINQKCIRNRLLSLNLARRQSKEVPEKKLVRYGDVLINSTGTGTLGRVAQCWQELSRCTVDTHVTIARPKDDVGKLWFGYMMMELESRFEDMGEGATNQKELKKALISIIQVNLPSRSIVSQFDDIVSNHARQISILSEQIDCLIKARDLLLPKLMNGEFAV